MSPSTRKYHVPSLRTCSPSAPSRWSHLGVAIIAGPGSRFGAFVLLALIAEGLFWFELFGGG